MSNSLKEQLDSSIKTNQKLQALFNLFYVTSPVVNLIPPLHIVSAENAFMVAAGICWMGEGDQVKIAKPWEPW